GDNVSYIDARQTDPIPRNKKIGYSTELGVSMHYQDISLNLFRVLIASEEEKTQIPGSKRSDVADKSGIEQEVLETLVLRRGKHDDDPGHVHICASGITIKSDGLMKLLNILTHSGGKNADQGIVHFIAHHLSVSWHKSKYQDNDSPVDGTEFKQITLSLSF
ncbi:MAG: hypothetical protein KAJ81_08560, partial [Candidatus Latescibacteria bacterium]|nr:hypothetical protein [Candidatus Latescibacterota bacterium]